jgi:hypothetical protein
MDSYSKLTLQPVLLILGTVLLVDAFLANVIDAVWCCFVLRELSPRFNLLAARALAPAALPAMRLVAARGYEHLVASPAHATAGNVTD